MSRVSTNTRATSDIPAGDVWVMISRQPLPIDDAMTWAVQPQCGAVVTFSGTVRDHSANRDNVTLLEYEAYEEFVVSKFFEIVARARDEWKQIHRVAILHRLGLMKVTESSVFIVVSAEHRDSAFEAAKFCIDTLKDTAPIWKKEQWTGGSDWGSDSRPITSVEELDQ